MSGVYSYVLCFRLFSRRVVINFIKNASYWDYNKILLECYDVNGMKNLNLVQEHEYKYDDCKL